jgi:hypothetical protein
VGFDAGARENITFGLDFFSYSTYTKEVKQCIRKIGEPAVAKPTRGNLRNRALLRKAIK